jgi:hypothetical protein
MNTITKRTLAATAAGGLLTLATAVPASAKPVWTEPEGRTGGGTVEGTSTITEIREVLVDDDAWELAQVGLGAVAGATLVGAVAVTLRRRQHHAPHPA